MKALTLAPEEVANILVQIDTNARASQRFKRLSAIAWRDAAIVSLLLSELTSKEICELRLADLKFSKLVVAPRWGGRRTVKLDALVVAPRWGGRRTVKLDAETRKYLDRYLEGAKPGERAMLFLSQRGKVINVRTIERMISKLGDQVGLYLVPSRLTISAEV